MKGGGGEQKANRLERVLSLRRCVVFQRCSRFSRESSICLKFGNSLRVSQDFEIPSGLRAQHAGQAKYMQVFLEIIKLREFGAKI